ncbi:MAG: M56 family metallopeptidase [Acidobacteriia bacterium]|nr:M56 family metallopeptidase [Terriglobia bacterium]
MLDAALSNLVPWLQQTILLTAAAALLPALFRLRHPRTQLAYCHVVLVLALLLPVLEPWSHPVVFLPQPASASPDTRSGLPVAPPTPQARPPIDAPESRASAVAPPAPFATRISTWTQTHIRSLLLAILGAGAALRFLWLLAGLWETRKHRIAATPLYPLPPSVEAACSITHAQAVFCISSGSPGPVMLGWLAPVVLLPESFLALDEEAQCGIVCHELLHVRRQDWLVTLLEETAGCLLWFNPAVWFLLAQTRLAREQVVDAETIRLTAAPEPYLEALLAIARERPVADLAPAAAPLFLRRRHLTQRLHLLLHEVSMSRIRLCTSYLAITAALATAGWWSVLAFPLIGSPLVQPARQDVAAAAASSAPAGPPQPAETRVTQTPETPRAQPRPDVVFPRFENEAPVPPDSHEPAVVPPQVAATPQDRAAALALLARARFNSAMHRAGGPPYRLDVSFVTSGTSGYSGSGTLTETWLSPNSWLWTAALGGYSQTQLRTAGATYSDLHGATPMAVHMVRNALFGPVGQNNQDIIRIASILWNGQPATCLLQSRVTDARAAERSRLWEETEYCVDNASGLLQILSNAPGVFAVFGYSRNVQLHGRTIPDRLTIYTGASGVLDAQITVAEAGSVDPSLFQPTAGMAPATVLGGPERFPLNLPSPSSSGAIQPVMVEAEVGVDGHILEQEVLAAADPSLAAPALEAVRSNPLPALGTQRQIFVNVRFLPRAGNAQ